MAVERLAILHCELCICKHGATTPASSVAAGTAPTPPTVPHARRRTPEDLDRDAIINEQQEEIIRLRARADEAKRERERADEADVRAHEAD
eukprot:387243-Prymnesium_polylepis.1